MNPRNIKVSVIMACYNSSAFLDEAISSVLGQTLSDLELILIDDYSIDNTLEIAKHYQIQDNRVSILSLPVNSGPATARNSGIRAARGEWLGILDSDDVATPARFEEQMRLADSEKGLVMIGSSSIAIDTKGNTIKTNRYPTNNSDLVKRLIYRRAFLPHSSITYRRDAVETLAAFNKRYVLSEDYDLWLRLSEIGRLTSIEKPLVKIREHETNISKSEGGVLQIRLSFAASICHFLRKHGLHDPSASNDEAEWLKFITWIERQLVEEGVFESREAWANARAEYFSTENRLTGTLRFGIRLLQSGHTGTLVREKFLGSSLPQRLAQEWTKRSCAAS